ncbi:hypothetical protein K0M31_001119 [Melipona bicolor]|uniref:Kielin/chordin-like protein n=1 Tax=Melipona bicolor TaxID=60889 RepID=A0AA40GEX2_9HYME|nr:hypothetical protein K0M31_001119 [Melipona bicolor]
MAEHDNSYSILQKCALMLLVVVQVTAEEICDKTKCPGPLRYYKELGCTPVHASNDECCPKAFDCSHLDKLSPDKCYANGHEYNVGELLKPEDSNPCNIDCRCVSFDDTASFICAAFDCPLLAPKSNCFIKNKHDSCCPDMSLTCLKDGEERATCEVDGVTYYDGHAFNPKSDPRLYCICMPGYTGNNTEPFCKKSNRSDCDPLFRNTDKVHRNCVPVYYDDQEPQSDCSFAYRCQSADDEVISNKSTDKPRGSLPDVYQTCRFGNLTMQLGDELSEGTGDYESYCMKCVCEVPPFPTCERIPFSDCDPMKYFKYPTNPIVANI